MRNQMQTGEPFDLESFYCLLTPDVTGLIRNPIEDALALSIPFSIQKSCIDTENYFLGNISTTRNSAHAISANKNPGPNLKAHCEISQDPAE
jgi:hypothetical protein